MKIVMFYHSLLSDYNHGNAHFLRGIVSELTARSHDVKVYEPADSWSLKNLLSQCGPGPVEQFKNIYPALSSIQYDSAAVDLDSILSDADLVLVHEWNEHGLVSRIGSHHARHNNYLLFFHDTHHRSVTAPADMAAYDLSNYDGVLAFGNCIANIYRKNKWAKTAWTWHEAADTRIFRPLSSPSILGDLVWIGNWGDDERTAELKEFLLEPVKSLGLAAHVHGVRYPADALSCLADAGITYAGYLPNFLVPRLFASYKFTLHVPRRPYVQALPGIPTIRVFEALACGIPLISTPWSDSEHLFTGTEFLLARTGTEMKQLMRKIISDPSLAAHLVSSGLDTILKRHTCSIRVDELFAICSEFGVNVSQSHKSFSSMEVKNA
jgi:spore maturation protein CgeB